MELDERKIIARRAAFELPLNGAINLGVGAPDGVASVASEEQVTPYLTMTTEAGAIGGVLAGGSNFGSSANADSVIDQNQMFDFYHGGGLDLTCLGVAEVDVEGNVNTSKFGGKLIPMQVHYGDPNRLHLHTLNGWTDHPAKGTPGVVWEVNDQLVFVSVDGGRYELSVPNEDTDLFEKGAGKPSEWPAP